MIKTPKHIAFKLRPEVRNLLLGLPAFVLFMFKKQYAGPFQDLIYSYAGNVTVSFFLYFVCLKLCLTLPRFGRFIAAALVLVCVESFELFDGFGFMTNTYDSFDLIANVIGVSLALSLDVILSKKRL
ncbi:MAG TPA: hypothetical protein DCQ28_02430 [Bacteroidetes bacterium]|nr:hypothetical protein [Bacteroidota bacterium]